MPGAGTGIGDAPGLAQPVTRSAQPAHFTGVRAINFSAPQCTERDATVAAARPNSPAAVSAQ
jgi:hypothetical protein